MRCGVSMPSAVFANAYQIIFYRVSRRCRQRPWSLDNFQAVFGNLTGEDARPTLWRGRPRPRKDREAVKAGQQIVNPPWALLATPLNWPASSIPVLFRVKAEHVREPACRSQTFRG